MTVDGGMVVISPKSVALGASYVRVVEVRLILSQTKNVAQRL